MSASDAAPHKELLKIYLETPDWNLDSPLTGFAQRYGHLVLFRCLLDGLHNDFIRFAGARLTWVKLETYVFGGDYDAADYVMLVLSMDEHAPGGMVPKDGGGHLLHTHGIEGRVSVLHEMIVCKERKKDEVFFETLKAERALLPAPYSIALDASLVEVGRLPLEALPPSLVDQAAERVLAGMAKIPSLWPEEQWSRAVLRRLLVEVRGCREEVRISLDVILRVAQWSSLEELIELTSAVPTLFRFSEGFERLVQAGEVDAESRACLWEEGVRRLDLSIWSDSAQPGLLTIFVMLDACAAAGRAPALEFDPALIRVVGLDRMIQSGPSLQSDYDTLRAAFSSLSLERRERIVLAVNEGFSWQLASIASTEAVGIMLANRLVSMGHILNGSNWENELIGGKSASYGTGALHEFGPEILKPFSESLSGKKFEQRHVVVAALAKSGHPDALPGLEVALGDSSKRVQKLAATGYVSLPSSVALGSIKAQLMARRKTVRIGAATALSAMPPTMEGVALAKERLTLEKVEEVKGILQEVLLKAGSAHDARSMSAS